MIDVNSNRRSYFLLKVELPDIIGYEKHFKEIDNQIENNVDIILASIKSTSQIYKFKSRNHYVYLFSTAIRKRKGQLIKLIEKNLSDPELVNKCDAMALLKPDFNKALENLKKDKGYKMISEPNMFEGYSGKDLEVFNDRGNWHPWQKEIHNMLFHKSNEIRNASDRKIISIYDKTGNTGKSSFFKFLYYHHNEDIGRVTYGTASQLRTSVSNIGAKKIYIIDLSRSKGKQDSEYDLLSAVEDIKNGVITSAMYGEGKTMLMDIPHVIISSNYLFDTTILSSDRWSILSLEKDKTMKDITKSVKRKQKLSGISKKSEMVSEN